MKKGGRNLVFEFLSIVIAVVLAMTLTEWRQTVLNYRQAESSFENIIEEIRDNHKELLGDSASVAQNVKDLAAWLELESDRKDTVSFSVNFQKSLMNGSAWDVAKLNESLTYLENDKVLRVSSVYESQEFYEKASGDVFDSMIEMVKIEDTNSPEYRRELIAFKFKIGLAYSGIVTYLQVSRNFLEEFSSSSDSTD